MGKVGPRACLRCHHVKEKTEFDLGPTGTRRKGVCRECYQLEADEKRAAHEARRVTFTQDGVLVRLCRSCSEVKPLDGEHFNGWRKDASTVAERWQYNCKPCQRRLIRRYGYVPVSQLPPDEAAERRARWRVKALRQIAKNPQVAKERQRRYARRVQADPVSREKRNELQRMYYRMRAEKAGRVITRRFAPRPEKTPRLPSFPVAVFVERLIAEQQALEFRHQGTERDSARLIVCERLGIDERTLYAWRSGERTRAKFDAVDRVLVNSGALWFDVFDRDRFPEEFLEAEGLFDPVVSERGERHDREGIRGGVGICERTAGRNGTGAAGRFAEGQAVRGR